MSFSHHTESAGKRLSRRGFLSGMVLVSAAAVVACAGGTAAPAGGTSPTTAASGTTPTTAAGGTTPTTAAGGAPASNAAAVKMTDANKYEPATITIPKGGTVTWTNASTMPHSATDDPAKAANKADALLPDGATAWDSSLLQPGQTFSHTFDVAGTYKYFCIPHESLGMLGTITVQ